MNKKIFTVGSLVLFIDQITKGVITNLLPLGKKKQILSFLSLTNVNNYGGAWSLLSGHVWFLLTFSVFSFVFLFWLSYHAPKRKGTDIAFGLLFGGLVGNFIDRLFFGYVRDFISLQIFNYSYPIFNVADMCLVLGVFLFLILMIKDEKNERDCSKEKSKKN